MQLSMILIAAMAVLVPSTLACSSGQDCCWGGSAGGWKGCMNQHGSLLTEDRAIRCDQLQADWCSNRGVTEAQCSADCCTVSTGRGRSCP
ncbi:hypothetical protein BP6252_09999 [Coleophoma cylindrospora]|uniref:Uncharacterized protein n=1 Tax=Coleophoma cylindrospora TaxID=1849047 RepID=A0A3D8QXV0_9HELO|nr:hypothetical protein BP6252_09999 [Coleophoma cylindrospora]